MAFLTDRYATMTPPVKRLAAFERLEIDRGARRTVRFDIPLDRFRFTNIDGVRIFEPGLFAVQVGPHTVEFEASLNSRGQIRIDD